MAIYPQTDFGRAASSHQQAPWLQPYGNHLGMPNLAAPSGLGMGLDPQLGNTQHVLRQQQYEQLQQQPQLHQNKEFGLGCGGAPHHLGNWLTPPASISAPAGGFTPGHYQNEGFQPLGGLGCANGVPQINWNVNVPPPM